MNRDRNGWIDVEVKVEVDEGQQRWIEIGRGRRR